ncbi:MAG TPA: hypothetical protein VNA30_05845 [Mycobacteriales bacterium]|nr:hypothetical protein [Mycobacteriales bacterium]
MSERNTLAHALHDIGLAAWFGGSLMGAVGVNGAASDVDDPRQRARVANAGWGRWTPFNAVAIGAHLLGGAKLLSANKGRVVAQKGVLANTNLKLALTAGALGATAYARYLGQKVMNAGDVPVAGGTSSLPETPPEVAKAQKQLAALQWAIPGLTGAMLASSALHEEQQRPSQVLKGTLQALPSRAAGAMAGAAGLVSIAADRAVDRAADALDHASVAVRGAADQAPGHVRGAASTVSSAAGNAVGKLRDAV